MLHYHLNSRLKFRGLHSSSRKVKVQFSDVSGIWVSKFVSSMSHQVNVFLSGKRSYVKKHFYSKINHSLPSSAMISLLVLSGKTKGVMYVVDTSAPECIGNATIHLVELLAQV